MGSGGLLDNLFIGSQAASASRYETGSAGTQLGLLLQGDQALVFGTSGVNRPDPRYLYWLNGGTGQMGNLVTH